MKVIRMRGYLASALAALFLMLVAAGCNEAPATPDASEPESESAAAVLEAYREYGGEIAEVKAGEPAVTADVAGLAGTIPAYDLTQGNPPCAGFLQAVPSLIFTVGEGVGTLQVGFTGNAGTTLIVVAEGEEIVCDEKAPVTMTPALTLDEPVAGRYGVWIGRMDMDNTVTGKLTVAGLP